MNELIMKNWNTKMALMFAAAVLFGFAVTFQSVFAVPEGSSCSNEPDEDVLCDSGLTCVGESAPSAIDGVCMKGDAFGVNKVEVGLGGTLGTQDLIVTVTQIINVALGLLGVVAVVIILIGGFKWMTAGGNEEKVGEARKLIFAGIIGLAIILASWAIARFVISNLASATGGGNVPGID